MPDRKKPLYTAHLNLMVTKDMDRELRDTAHRLRMPMAEYVRSCIARDLTRRERNHAQRAGR
jgi:hypothetical protein